MSGWWEEPYPGKPMLPVPGFPRPLYPPNAAPGRTPSEDGPDVVAYKRTVSRLGRWPWQTFDAAFSNGFSGGTSGNVGNTGVAGCQRQQPDIEPTGYVGEQTFNFFRSAIIPQGLPNAGEYGMDVTAQNLVAEAFQIFNGKPTPPPPVADLTLRRKALNRAISQIGYVEGRGPFGTGNDTKYGKWYGVNYQPWCAIFCTWCFEMEGDSPSFVRNSRYAFVPYIVSDASNVRFGLSLTSNPIPGDLVCYDWDGGVYDHVGIFKDGDMSSWKAVEGNTSVRSNSNGGSVMERDRRKGQASRVAFIRVREPLLGG